MEEQYYVELVLAQRFIWRGVEIQKVNGDGKWQNVPVPFALR